MSYIGSKRSSSLVSATDITLDGAKLKSSGDSITKSDGTTAVLSESAGVVTLNNGTIGSGVVFPTFVGMIASFATSTFTDEFGTVTGAPAGWLVCNGAQYAIADYGDLHTAIGTTWGALTNGSGGAGSTHFRVPDLRGEFLRGFDNGQGNDPDAASRTGGDAVGSSQTSAFSSHYHNFDYYDWGGSNINGNTYKIGLGEGDNSTSGIFAGISLGDGQNYYAGNRKPTLIVGGVEQDTINPSFSISANGSNENRPRNKYVQYCIKY